MSYRYELSPWPDWSQLKDMPPPGIVTDAPNDCGPESVAECVKHITGVELEAGYIREEMYRAGYRGYTDVAHLAHYLQDRCECPVVQLSGQAQTKLQPAVVGALSKGYSIIVLFFWDLKALTGGHFCPIVSCTEQVVTRSNPWTAGREQWSWAHFEQFQQDGIALQVQRRRSIAR